MHTYRKDGEFFSVGHYSPRSAFSAAGYAFVEYDWRSMSTYVAESDAACMVNYLNGGDGIPFDPIGRQKS